MAALHGSANIMDDAGNFEEEHEFETFAREFIELNDWHEVATDRNDLDKIETFSEHQELPSMNIVNITGIVSDDGSTGPIPWSPSSRPTLSDESQLSLSHELVYLSQQTSSGNLFDHSNPTLANATADLSVQTESYNEEFDNSEAAAAVALQVEVDQLKKEMAALVFMNNRYHLAISNCTFCALDDDTSNASTSFDASIRASTPVCKGQRSSASFAFSSSGPTSLSRTIPPLMSLLIDDRTKATVKAMKKRRDKTFISRMVTTLTKLETKYLTPRHNSRGSKKQLYTKNHKNSPIVPDELASNYDVLAAPKTGKLTVSEPIPHIRIEPALPNHKLSRVHSCSQDNEISRKDYQESKGTYVIDMARNKRIKKTMPPNYAWDSFDINDESDKYETKPSIITQIKSWCLQQSGFLPPNSCFIHWFKGKYQAMDTRQLRSLAEGLVKLADEPNPYISSDSSHVQFKNESTDEPQDPCDDSSCSLSSISHSHYIHHGNVVVILHADYHEVTQRSLISPDDHAVHQAMHGYGGGFKGG